MIQEKEWVLAEECIEVHDPRLYARETDGGWMDDPRSMHHHWMILRRRNPHCSKCGGRGGGPFGHEASECTWTHPAEKIEVVPSEELEIKFPIFVANLVIVDAGSEEVLLDLKMSGRHRVVLDLLTLAADTVKEDIER